MIKQIFTTKGNTDQLFVEARRRTVTWLNLPKQVVVKITQPTGVASATLQVAIGEKHQKPNQPLAGQFKAAQITQQPKYVREIKLDTETELKAGDLLPIDQIISEGDLVKVTGVSKGKGFAGVVKRHHFAGGPKTHGQSDRQRAPGSISRGTTPGRVLKGKKMAGHMGSANSSVRNLKIIALDLAKHQLAVSGPVPGAKNGLVTVTVIKKHA